MYVAFRRFSKELTVAFRRFRKELTVAFRRFSKELTVALAAYQPALPHKATGSIALHCRSKQPRRHWNCQRKQHDCARGTAMP